MECNGQGVIIDSWLARISVWLSKKLRKGLNERRFLYGYCEANEVKDLEGELMKVQSPDQSLQQYQGLVSLFNADVVEQYGPRDKIIMFGVDGYQARTP